MTVISPFLRNGKTTRGMMTGMILCPSIIAAHFTLRYDPQFALRYILYLGFGACLDVFYAFLNSGRPSRPSISTMVTTALLVLSIPARMPWWQTMTGITVAIIFGKKMVDRNALRVNPMLLGRLFMMIVFADSIQTWLAPGIHIDALSSATPLGLQASEGVAYPPLKIWLGDIHGNWESVYAILPGSPGEVLPPLSLMVVS